MQRHPRSARFAILFTLALALAAPAAPVVAAPAAPVPAASAAAEQAAFSITLHRPGDFVSQYTAHWCIGASMQMMLNIIGVTDDRTRETQADYMELARTVLPRRPGSPRRRNVRSEDRGAGSAGWTRALTVLGGGGYYRRGEQAYGAAIEAAAYALRKTNRPVGLLVWRGAHAWVMSGFTATADPLVDPDARITGVYVLDPWYPRVSSIWGPGQEPGSWVSVDALAADFLPYRPSRRNPTMVGKFVLVLPFDMVTRVVPGWKHA